MTDEHLHAADLLPQDMHATIERQAEELAKLKGFIGYYTSMICPECFYGHYNASQIEKGLSADVRTIFHGDGGVTITTGMGS